MEMDNLDYTLLFVDLILATQQNNLELTKHIVTLLNQYIPSNENETLITQSDIYKLEIDNESFNYFLDNYEPTDEYVEQAIWDIKSRFMIVHFANNLISQEELQSYIYKILEDTDSPIRKYRYTSLVRMALMYYDYDLIIKIKQLIQAEKEEVN